MKVFATASMKGGIGKTMESLSLAYVASNEFNEKVLLVDMDPQSSSSIILGVTPNNYDKRTPFDDIPTAIKKLEGIDFSYEIDELDEPNNPNDYIEELDVNGIHTIFDRMLDGEPLTKDFIDTCIHKPVFSLLETKKDGNKIVKDENGNVVRERNQYYFGFDLIPSTEYLSDIQLIWGTSEMRDKRNVGRQLDFVLDFIEKNYDYDTVIIDCPPSLELLTINSMYAAKDGIIIPVSQDRQSLFSLSRIKRNIRDIKHARETHYGALGIVLTIFNPKRTVDSYIAKTVGNDIKLKVFNTKISETADAKKALLSGLILPQINARNYSETVELYKEILERHQYLSERYEQKEKGE